MAVNIFELIIGNGAALGTELRNYDVPINNQDLHDWFYNPLYNMMLPQFWSVESNVLQAIPIAGYNSSLQLHNENFNEGFSDIYVNPFLEALYDVRDSFIVAQGWDFNMFTIANDGLDSSGAQEIEYDTTPSFAYYTEGGHYTMPDLTVYGRKNSQNVNAERVGLVFSPRYISNASSVHPSQIINRMDEPYLFPLYTASTFALKHNQRLNYGSLRSQNIMLAPADQSHSLSVTVGDSARVIKILDNPYTHYNVLVWNFNAADNNFYNFINENSELLLGTKKYSNIPSSNFPKYPQTNITVDYPLPSTIISLENIFQSHTIGKVVELELTLNSISSTTPQQLIGCYTDGTSSVGGDYDDIQATSVLYNVDSNSNITGTQDGKWHPKEAIYSQAFNQDTVEAPVRAETTTSHKKLFFGGNFFNDNRPFSVARVKKTLKKSTTYHVSFNVESCNNGAKVNVYALGNNDIIVEPLMDEVTINPVSPSSPEEITHFTFNTHKALDRISLEVKLNQNTPSGSFIRINYVRFSQSTYAIIHQNVNYVRDDNLDEVHQMSPDNSDGFLTAHGLICDAPIVVTTSNLRKRTISYTKHQSSSPYYEQVYYNDSEFLLSDIKSDVENFIQPFHKSDGTFSQEESQLKRGQTKNIHLLNNPDLIDSDGFYTSDFTTIRMRLEVGSSDLHMFADSTFGDMWVSSKLNIKKIEFFDSKDSFITQNASGENRVRFKYNPANGVKAPEAVQREEIPESQIGNEVLIDYKVDSLSGGDSLMVDFGEDTPALEISSAGTSSGTIIAQGSRLRIRTQTAAEKGSALTGLDSIIDYIKVTAQHVGNQIFIERKGNINSSNVFVPYVGAYDSAMRVKNVNVQTLALSAGVASISFVVAIDTNQIAGASSVTLQVVSGYLSSGSQIDITQGFLGSENTTSITTTSLSSPTNITVNNIPNDLPSNFTTALITVTLKTVSAGDTLDAYINSLKLTARFEEPTDGKEDITLDLFNDFDVSFNASIKDYRDLESSSSSFSKTITLPATAKNKLAFNFQNELQALSTKYSATANYLNIKPIKFLLKADGMEVFSGIANLLNSSLDENGAYELETNLISGNADWVEPLKEMELKTLPSKQYEISSSTILEGALEPSLNDEICFPLIDNGKWKARDSENPDAVNVGWGNIKAAFSLKMVLESIFKQIGYSLVSKFFNENNEYNDDFSLEFGSFKDRLLGIAPSMNKPDFFIQNTALNISFDPNLFVGANQGVSQFSALKGSEQNPRPYVPSSLFLGFELQTFPRSYYLDWAFINCNVVNQDKGSFHSYEDISLTTILGGVEFLGDNPASSKYKLKGNNLGQSKSIIQVNKSDYYDLSAAINFTLTQAVGTQGFGEGGDEFQKTFITVILVDSQFANDDIYLSNNGFAFNTFDLFDENSVELFNTDYENTRVSISRSQYLEVGKKYNIVVLMGTRGLSVSLQGQDYVFNCGFQVNELDLSLQVSKGVAPMGGRYYSVYTSEAKPKVSYLEVLPDVKAIDFISELTKIFNLNWTANNLTKEVTVEPFSMFYDFTGSAFSFKDFTEKALITKISNNEIINTDLVYAMKEDSSDYSVSNGYQGDSSISFGDKKIYLSLNGLSNPASLSDETQGVSLDIFSALKMGNAKFISRTNSGNPYSSELTAETDNLVTKPIWIPRIWGDSDSTLEPTIPEQKPESNNSHEYKLCLLKGTKYTDKTFSYINSSLDFNNNISNQIPCIHYSLEEFFIADNSNFVNAGEGLFRCVETAHPAYLEVGSYFPFEPNTPSAIFSDVNGSSGSENGLFNEYHQSLIDMLMMRDKIITAEIYLTVEDIRSLNFRQLIKIDKELYIINKIKDFNFSGEPTEVELLLVTRTGTNHEIL